ncbi:tyrosine-type recombinase/integrase [Streptomyces sp. NPDC018833]|uniref:tyrosine-type recombinase/integrase n=1 Tax=Streptomyces sp. NPDC018833 TaxID=3365053 RepID=UPI0037A8B899
MTTSGGLRQRAGGAIERPGTRAEDAYAKIRDDLGLVAPRDPVTNVLGPRQHRLALLSQMCDHATFRIAVDWLSSSTIPSINTKRNYADDLRVHWWGLAQELGYERFSIGCIGRGDVREYRLSEERRGSAPRSINRRMSALSSLTIFAAEEAQIYIPNPVTRHDRIRIDRHDRTTSTPVLELDDIGALYEWAECLRDVVVTALVYTFAGRVTEWCAADVTDLRDGRSPVVDLTRKGNKGRQWPLPPLLAELLVKLIDSRTSGPLLLDSRGQRLDRHDVDRILTRLGRRSDVLAGRDVTPHVLRASRLTHMHDAGEKLEDIQAFADHEDPATTLAYIQRRDDVRRKARQAADGVDHFSALYGRWLVQAV